MWPTSSDWVLHFEGLDWVGGLSAAAAGIVVCLRAGRQAECAYEWGRPQASLGGCGGVCDLYWVSSAINGDTKLHEPPSGSACLFLLLAWGTAVCTEKGPGACARLQNHTLPATLKCFLNLAWSECMEMPHIEPCCSWGQPCFKHQMLVLVHYYILCHYS